MSRKLLIVCSLLGLVLPFGKTHAEEAAIQQETQEPAAEPSVSVGVGQRTWQPPAAARRQRTKGPSMTVLTSARNCPVDEGFFFTADFLWWKANDDAMNWALTVTQTVGTSSDFGVTHYLEPDWKPAFRAGLGWNTSYDGWDLYANWTWYNNSTSETITAATVNGDDEIGIRGPWIANGGNITGINAANYRWRLRHNMFDLELGRKFFVSRKLSMRPFAGVRGGWINRRVIINYLAQPNVSFTPVTPAVYFGRSKYWGVGPRFGLNNEWYLGAGFQIYTDLAASLLYGQIYTYRTTADQQVDGSLTRVSDISANDDLWRVIPNMQLFLGIGWGECFCSQDIFLAIKAGWEVNKYWNLGAFFEGRRGQIFRDEQFAAFTLQGLTVKVDLEF